MSTIQINGVTTEVPAGAIAYKYADPTEGARWIYDESEMQDIRREDPSLIVEARAKFAVMVQTEAGRAFKHLANWDEEFTSRKDAEASAERARAKWNDAKVVEL